VYSATKAGLVGATQALRAELAGTGVSVSAVCPGFVEREGMYATHVNELGVRASRWIGVTTPEKVAEAVLRAIERDAPELIVTPGPFRILLAVRDLLPALGVPVTNRLVYRQLRTVADDRRERQRPTRR
jgi:short-subunit dehydrogenase